MMILPVQGSKCFLLLPLLLLGEFATKLTASSVFSYNDQSDWNDVTCGNHLTCPGYPDKFLNSKGFSVEDNNNCQWCTPGHNCGLHRQSPIDLQRDRGVIGGPNEKDCPDWHHMTFHEGTCTWSDMQNQFSIERHALKIQTPMSSSGQIDCANSAGQRFYPKLDYSKGFPDFWLLDSTSVTLPSQHSQDGTHYDAEVILAHSYEKEHPKNKIGQVSIFLDAYDNVSSWPFLDKLICQWRKAEEKVRQACGLSPASPYGRCSLFRNQRATKEWIDEDKASRRALADKNRRLRTAANNTAIFKLNDIFSNDIATTLPNNATFREIEDFHFERLYAEYKQRSLDSSGFTEDYTNVPWFSYEWLLKVETEYYFRYEGTQTIPPCYQTVHWRVLKDPIRVHPQQIKELNRLLAWRRSPSTCDLDTAGTRVSDNQVKVDRELQYIHNLHRMVFCECKDFTSIFANDRAWCQGWQSDKSYSRFYDHPYSF